MLLSQAGRNFIVVFAGTLFTSSAALGGRDKADFGRESLYEQTLPNGLGMKIFCFHSSNTRSPFFRVVLDFSSFLFIYRFPFPLITSRSQSCERIFHRKIRERGAKYFCFYDERRSKGVVRSHLPALERGAFRGRISHLFFLVCLQVYNTFDAGGFPRKSTPKSI